uniref:Uncharacterized protein n=1 Tax=Arundo donax TaxID=35708 RepID=A0A0A8ZNN2_ARUDO
MGADSNRQAIKFGPEPYGTSFFNKH